MSHRVAIVHDWLVSMRGAERVVEVLCNLFPQADVFTLTWDPARLSPGLAKRRATTSPIHHIAKAPFVGGRFRGLLPLFPLAVQSFDLAQYDLVLSSSHCVAIGARAPAHALHVAYVHSPLRYVREAQGIYEASVADNPLALGLLRGTAHYLRRWEDAASARPHVLIANSTYTQDRIRRYYRRDAEVIEPPIETHRFERAAGRVARPHPDAPFLLVSALVPYKRVGLAVRAFQGRPERLVVVGEGPERARLEGLIGPNVTLLPRVDEVELAGLYSSCRALLHTAIDDFGMVMVEALAAGKPVLACAEGGALDIVREGETGMLIEAPTVEAVRAALDRFAQSPAFQPSVLQHFARRFDRANFERRFAQAIEVALREHRDTRSNGVAHNGSHNGAHRDNGVGNGVAQSNGHHRGAKLASDLDAIDPDPARGGAADFSGLRLAGKRLVDVVLAGAGLVLTAPLQATLAALIALDSPGPVLFRQRRPGLDGRPFTMIKLRTMDARGRVTRVGRLLRPMGLDELPQLWNVVKGEMSLVGPRPEVLERAVRFESDNPDYGARYRMRPGITGWAQVNGLRGEFSIARQLQLDMEYVRRWSLAMDGAILLRSVSTVCGDTLRELRG
jgi:lipopolysaccharide/colanic/teichoic acid biosynthesis glycosyltransferase/glycosyltransferase involved in cell wall biosynthesis